MLEQSHVLHAAQFSYPSLVEHLTGFVSWFRRDLPVMRIEIGRLFFR
jgi:hypothetical protein